MSTQKTAGTPKQQGSEPQLQPSDPASDWRAELAAMLARLDPQKRAESDYVIEILFLLRKHILLFDEKNTLERCPGGWTELFQKQHKFLTDPLLRQGIRRVVSDLKWFEKGCAAAQIEQEYSKLVHESDVIPGDHDFAQLTELGRYSYATVLSLREFATTLLWIRDRLIAQWEKAAGVDGIDVPTRNDRPKRPRRRQTGTLPLTARQVQAMQLYGEHKGNVSAAAKVMGVDRSTFKHHYKAACAKMGEKAVKQPDRVKMQGLPHDKRGQVAPPVSGRRAQRMGKPD